MVTVYRSNLRLVEQDFRSSGWVGEIVERRS